MTFKTPVPTYSDNATTYPTPELGWTVQTENDGKFYRWDGESWKYIQYLNTTQISQLSSDISSLAGVGRTTETIKNNADNIGDLEALETDDKSNIVAAVNEVKTETDAHLAERMPHQLTDTDTSKNYKYGLKIVNNYLAFMIEEV